MQSSDGERTERAVTAYSNLARATAEMDKMLDQQLCSFGVTTNQFRALAALLAHGPMSQVALGDEIVCPKSSVAAAIEILEEDKLVERRPNERNRRETIVQLTAEGKKLAMRIAPRQARLIRAQMTVLDAREQKLLARLCEKLADGDAVKFIRDITLVDENE